MYVCICNQITEDMIKNDPSLIKKIGTNCGKCKEQLQKSNLQNTAPLDVQIIKYA